MKGRGEYPEDWDAIALAVKEAADWRCVRCGHPDSPAYCEEYGRARGHGPCDWACRGHHFLDGRRRVLTVHHLDGDKENCRWWNLPALCQVCHLQVQGKVKMDQAYLHPHTEWMRPYVAGYYAFAVLGEELTRRQVEGRLEELLRAGQPHLDEVIPDALPRTE